MTRSRNIAAVGGFALTVTMASLLAGCPSGGVGDPCIPEDEYKELFAGFKLTEENIESRSFQCQTRICLVNHFQGRVSCERGQAAPALCAPGTACPGAGQQCLPSDMGPACENDGQCATASGYYCHDEDADPTTPSRCRLFVCSNPDDPANYCFIPGTTIPVASEVCGQCGNRKPDVAVYCSCRCGVAEGEAEDENFNFCECPEGYVCSEIRKNVGLGDTQLTGKYCIKENTAYEGETQCGPVQGHWAANCKGQATGG